MRGSVAPNFGWVENVAQHDDALGQSGGLARKIGGAGHDDGAGHAVEDLPVRLEMRVRMVPEQSGRLRLPDGNTVVQRLARHRVDVDRIVGRRIGRRRQPVKMDVGNVERFVRRRRQVVDVRKVDRVAGRNANRRRHERAVVLQRRAARRRIDRGVKRQLCDAAVADDFGRIRYVGGCRSARRSLASCSCSCCRCCRR